MSKIIHEKNVPAVMRDGTTLYADVFRPEGEGKYPVLLQRTPYNRTFLPLTTMVLDPIAAAHQGYVVIIQDVRGRFDSEGDPFYIYKNEYNDGYDSVEWAASLPYSDGNVGMYGLSYKGMTQFQAAVMQPPHLKAIFPITWGTDVFMYRGGALELGLIISWTLATIGPNAVIKAKQGKEDFIKEFMTLVHSIDHIDEAGFNQLPIQDSEWLKLGDGFASFFHDILEHDTKDEYHLEISVQEKSEKLNVPVFGIAGWYDLLLGQDLEHFEKLKHKKNTKLMIGPWAHAGFSPTVGDLNFGLSASSLMLDYKIDLTSLQIKWFDRWLKGMENGIEEEAPVKIFVMGENKWRNEQEWPLQRTVYTPFYFNSNGKANTKAGDGALTLKRPQEESFDRYIYDPENPVPTLGGNHLMPMNYPRGPIDQQFLETREDVLVYTSEVLEEDLEVTGPVKVILYASSSAVDTDFTAKLVDVHPNGKAYNIVDGIIRAKNRDKNQPPSLLTPNEVYLYEIDLLATSNLFKKGHQLRVEISSSNFPRFDRNTNTGESGKNSKELKSAEQRVFHSERYPSHILLPVIPRD
ncbi:CocE/NonD family hydrolase [Paenibacillus sp. BSR1-1]|uniref:CocE/NonD family hydrolase n=1 Tax=Paenibacillus sp. BSR1-1 TaxID=3020845 RepID=UPI0025B0454F|nr:CocE/NonD family hydrolase [Paenibacillus sp. BSR1-1]MDN3016087.1 CocE/NonD family hydrolase [Paenibacillus sp. BSR1-1]